MMKLFKAKEGKPAGGGKEAAPVKNAPARPAREQKPARPAREKKAKPVKPQKPKVNKEIPGLLKDLDGTDWSKSEASAAKLLAIGTEAVSPLCRILKQPGILARRNAAFVLGWLKDKTALPALIEQLDHESGHVREATAFALGSLGDSGALTAITRKLREEERPDVRLALVRALEAIGDPACTETLLGTLQDKDLDLRLAAVKALGRLGTIQSVMIRFPGFEVESQGGVGAPAPGAESAGPEEKPAPEAGAGGPVAPAEAEKMSAEKLIARIQQQAAAEIKAERELAAGENPAGNQ